MVPDKVEKLCLRAQQAIAAREWEKAKQVYLMALGLRSDLPDVHYGLATVYFQLRELTSAAHHFREVTRLDPQRAGAYVNLGAILNLMGQYDDAVAALRRSKGDVSEPLATDLIWLGTFYVLGLFALIGFRRGLFLLVRRWTQEGRLDRRTVVVGCDERTRR